MDYIDSKRTYLGTGESLIFKIPHDLYLEAVEVIAFQVELFTPLDLSTIDIDVTKHELAGAHYLTLDIQEFPIELEGFEIEIRVVGITDDVLLLEHDEDAVFSTQFLEDWA